MSVNLIATLKSKKNELAGFTEIMEQMKVNLPKVDGCHSVKIFQDNRDPCVFTLLEVWGNETQHEIHIKEFVKSGGWEKLSSHLAEDPESGFFREL